MVDAIQKTKKTKKKLEIIDVPADGNCFYYAIYGIISEAIHLPPPRSPTHAVRQVRKFVAHRLETDPASQMYISNTCEIFNTNPDPSIRYLLKETNPFINNYPRICRAPQMVRIAKVAKAIRVSRGRRVMWASQLEQSILAASALAASITVITLSKTPNLFKDLERALKNVKTQRIGILVNDNNIHFQYMKYNNEPIMNTRDIRRKIKSRVDDSR